MTFEDDSDMSDMDGMDMKLRWRMDMGAASMGTTSEECYASNIPYLQTLAYCFQQRCGDDGVTR